MDKFLMSSPSVEYDQRIGDLYEPISFEDERIKRPSHHNSIQNPQMYPGALTAGPQLPSNPLLLNGNNLMAFSSSTLQQQLQVQQQFHLMQLQKQQLGPNPSQQHLGQAGSNARTSQSLLELIPQLLLSVLNQLLLDSPALLYNTVTPRKTGRKKSSSVSSVNLYATPSRGNYLPAGITNQPLSQQQLQQRQQQQQLNNPTSNQWLAAASTANGAPATYSNKVGKTPHRGHSRLRSRLSLDANNTPFLLSASVNLNPFYTPSSFELPSVNDDLLGGDLEVLENFDGTPLPTPHGLYLKLPTNQSFLIAGSGGSGGSGGSTNWYEQIDGYVTPMALQRNDLDGIKIEDQDDDALKQLRKAKSQMRLKLCNGNEFGGVLNRPTPASAPPSNPGGLFLDEIASHIDHNLAQLTPGIHISDNLPPLYLYAPGEMQTVQHHHNNASFAHRQNSQGLTDFVPQSAIDYNIDLIQGFGNRGPHQQTLQPESLLPPMASFSIQLDQQSDAVTTHLNNQAYLSGQMQLHSQPSITSGGIVQSRNILQPIDPKKKHPCPLCDARFQRPEHVKRHMKSHLKEKPYTCDEPKCGKRFNRKDNLKAHLKKIHKRI